jgi:hypothetical protein
MQQWKRTSGHRRPAREGGTRLREAKVVYRRLTIVLAASLVGGALSAGSALAQLADCPTVMPVDEVAEGMNGIGYTVSKGEEPEQFTAEILGVMENGIGPGRDLIVVDVDSEAIRAAGGIWAGMSGSPVYVNGELVGAIAFGLSFGPSTIGGMTPAEDMLDIAERPTTSAREVRKVSLDREMVRTIERATSSSSVSSTMKRLNTPLSISGAGPRVMEEISEAIERENLPLIPYSGASASATQQQTPEPVEPGGNFAAVLSYGDVTFAGVGTATYVCEGKVLAFGHPFFYFPQGETTAGGSGASAITIVNDPTFGSYKLANVTGSVGTVDQDRFAGIRALLGAGPTTIPVTSTVQTADGLSSRDGSSSVVGSEFVPMIAMSHMLSNIDFTWDEIGPGSSALSWTISGTTESGEQWQLERSNVFADEYDISYGSLFELELQLYTLFANQFEDIEFTSVDVDVTVDDEIKRYKLVKTEVSGDGVEYSSGRRVRIDRGGTIYLRFELEPFDETENIVVESTVEVPRSIKTRGFLRISGQQYGNFYDYYCFTEYAECSSSQEGIESLSDLIESFETAPKGNDMSIDLYGGRGGLLSEQLVSLDEVVTGRRNITIIIQGSGDGTSGSKPVGEGKPPQG